MNPVRKKISVITPCLDEEQNVEQCYLEVKAVFEDLSEKYQYEHIFADNGSSDNTAEQLRVLAREDKNVKVILNTRNFGVFRSTLNAMFHSTGDAVIPMLSADLQDPPSLIPQLIAGWEDGYDVVAGKRATRDESFLIVQCRHFVYQIVNKVSEFPIPVDVGEYQLIDRKILDTLRLFDEKDPYIRGMIASCGYPTLIVSYKHKARASGSSKFNFFEYLNISLNALISYSNLPLRLALYTGFVISSTSIIYALFLFFRKIFFDIDLIDPGMMTLLIGMFFLSGVIILFLGIIGEYIAGIHRQSHRGPLVIEREKINFDQSNTDVKLE